MVQAYIIVLLIVLTVGGLALLVWFQREPAYVSILPTRRRIVQVLWRINAPWSGDDRRWIFAWVAFL